MSGEIVPQFEMLASPAYPPSSRSTSDRERSLLDILETIVASPLDGGALFELTLAIRETLDLLAVTIVRIHEDRVEVVASSPPVLENTRTRDLRQSVFRHAHDASEQIAEVESSTESELLDLDGTESVAAHLSRLMHQNEDAVGIASFAHREELESGALRAQLDAIGAIFSSRLHALSQLSSERKHLDRLVMLQNLTARIIRQDEHIEADDDLLAELATSFDFEAVSIGLVYGEMIEFYSQYRDAIARRGIVTVSPAASGVIGDVLRTGAPRFPGSPPADRDQRMFPFDVRQMICVPLRINGGVLGVLLAADSGRRPLVVDDLGTLTMLAESLGMAIANFRRFYEVERRNHQLRLVDNLVTMIAEGAMTQQAAPEIAREIADLFGFQLVAIGLIHNRHLSFTLASINVPMPPIGGFGRPYPVDRGVAGRVIASGRAELIDDVRSDPDYIDTGWDLRSQICVPIRAGGKVIGVLDVESGPDRPLDEADLEVLTIIARHIGIAFEHEDLLASERATRRALEALHQVSTIVTSTLDVDEALRRVVDTLGSNFDYRYVVAGLIDGRFIQPSAAHGVAIERLVRFPIESSRIGQVAATGETLFIPEMSSRRGLGLDALPDCRSLIAAPIIRDEEILGVLIVIGSRSRSLSEQDVKMLEMYAQHAGVVLDNARMYEDARRMAYIDPITQLPNHRRFQERFGADLQRAEDEERPLAVVVLDLDGFKEVNDRFGHLEGDAVLTAVGRRLNRRLRMEDLLARYAGDEFVVLLPGADERVALNVADRLRAAIANDAFVVTADEAAILSISAGIALYPDHGSSTRDLLSAADRACYEAKRAGGNQVRMTGD